MTEKGNDSRGETVSGNSGPATPPADQMATDSAAAETLAPRPSRSKRWRLRTVLTALLVVIIALAGLWVFGPREPAQTALRFDPATIGADVDAYIVGRQAALGDIVPGAERKIVWADPRSRSRTQVALVYVHGFSASPGEIRPVPDMVARQLGANLFYTRLTGHGRTADAMAEATVQDWMDDLAEAVAIGERLGETVIVIGTSTGGTLAAIAATHRDLADRIGAIIFVSPNFRLKAAGSGLLTMPFARQIVPLLAGAERGFEPQNERHARYWTNTYRTVALLPMAAAVRHAASGSYQNTKIPALFVFSDADQVVDPVATRAVVARWGGPATIEQVTEADDALMHVIAGDALSPSNNAPIARTMADWVTGLNGPPATGADRASDRSQ